MTRVAAYLRVSSEDQKERKTIENQLEFATKYCDLHQLEIVDWYKDDGVTGTLPIEEREEGLRLLNDAKQGKFDSILIYKLDRLGRSARVILNAVHELESYNVKIRSMNEPFDTGDPNGRFLLTILAGVADLERETIIDRMWHGANNAARKGKWLGGIVPYGYRKNEDGFLEINEDPLPNLPMSEADVIRLIYNLIANQGYSTVKIADYLNDLNIPPSYIKDNRQIKKGKRKENTSGIWRPNRIRNMIINTTYKGIHQYGKRTKKDREIIEREVPAIISEEIWEKSQQVLKDNQIEAMRNTKRKYLLKSLIKCGTCGLTYIGTAYNSNSTKDSRKLKGYYVCGGKISYRGPLNGKCTSKNVPQLWIEDMVWNDCVNFINNPGDAIHELSSNMDERKNEKNTLETELFLLKNSIHAKENETQSILDLYRKKIISHTDVEKQLQNITLEKESLERQIRELEEIIKSEDTLLNQFDTVHDLLNELKSKLTSDPPYEIKREIVKALVREIIVNTVVDENGRSKYMVSVTYSFARGVVRTDKGSLQQPALFQQESHN